MTINLCNTQFRYQLVFLYTYMVGRRLPLAVADPGFPIGGALTCWGGHQPPTHTLFGKNICKNERN